jgi:hypothetical protein
VLPYSHPSQPGRGGELPYQLLKRLDSHGGLDWDAVTRLLEPQRQRQRSESIHEPDRDLTHLARWVACQQEGNRNAGLFWAANRALEAYPAADLSPLATAASQAGLGEEIARTLESARKGSQGRPSRLSIRPRR